MYYNMNLFSSNKRNALHGSSSRKRTHNVLEAVLPLPCCKTERATPYSPQTVSRRFSAVNIENPKLVARTVRKMYPPNRDLSFDLANCSCSSAEDGSSHNRVSGITSIREVSTVSFQRPLTS